jgi:hypothetical protein
VGKCLHGLTYSSPSPNLALLLGAGYESAAPPAGQPQAKGMEGPKLQTGLQFMGVPLWFWYMPTAGNSGAVGLQLGVPFSPPGDKKK